MSNPCICNASTNTPSMFRQEHTALLSVFHESDFELLRSNPPSHNPDFVRSQNHSTSTATSASTTTNPFDQDFDGEATTGTAHPRSAPARTVPNGNPFEDIPEHPDAIPVARAVDEDSEQVVVPLVPAVFLGDDEEVNDEEVNDDEVNVIGVNNDDEESARSSIRDSGARNTSNAANSRPRPPEPSAIRSPGQFRRRPPLSFETGSDESASASASASSHTIYSIRSSSTRSNSSTHTRSARLDVDVDVDVDADADVEPNDPWSAEEWLGNGDLSRASPSSPSSTPAVEASSRSNSGSSINGRSHRNRWNLRASPEEAARKLRVRLEKGSALCWQTVAQTTRKAAAAASASRSRW